MLVDNIEVRQPSLDDVFFSLTGEHVDEGRTPAAPVDDDGEDGGGGPALAGRVAVRRRRSTVRRPVALHPTNWKE